MNDKPTDKIVKLSRRAMLQAGGSGAALMRCAVNQGFPRYGVPPDERN